MSVFDDVTLLGKFLLLQKDELLLYCCAGGVHSRIAVCTLSSAHWQLDSELPSFLCSQELNESEDACPLSEVFAALYCGHST